MKKKPNVKKTPVGETFEDLFNARMASKERRQKFAELLTRLSDQIGFRISVRGWCYILEQKGIIRKDKFVRVRTWINACRKNGELPIDFIADEAGRDFRNVIPSDAKTPAEALYDWIKEYNTLTHRYCGDWLAGEDTYIQLIVENLDLVRLFEPTCKIFNIPIASSKGWSSMLQRAQYARRFAVAQERGLDCVLLYCGDHDPDGLRMSECIRKNLADVQNVVWSTGYGGYDPSLLKVHRFGLNWDWVIDNDISVIDNLITASGKDLGSPKHSNSKHQYVVDYIRDFGCKKAEASAMITTPAKARALLLEAIEYHLGTDAKARFTAKRQAVVQYVQEFMKRSGFDKHLASMVNLIREEATIMKGSEWNAPVPEDTD